MTELVLDKELEMFTSAVTNAVDSTFDQVKEFTFRGLKGIELSKKIFCNDEFRIAYNEYYDELKEKWLTALKDGSTYQLVNPKGDCYMIHPSTRVVDGMQITSFTRNGIPLSHSTYECNEKLIEDNAHILILGLFRIKKSIESS